MPVQFKAKVNNYVKAMEEDASFETDSDGTVQLGESGSSNVKTPGGQGDSHIDKESNTTIVEFDWDTGNDKGEARTDGGSGKVELDTPDPPSTGENPTGEGEPLTGEAGGALNGSGSEGSGGGSGSGAPRAGEGRGGSRSGTPGKRVYNNIGELEKEVEGERKNIKGIAEKLVKECKERQDALQGKVNQAGAKHNELAKGVFGKLPPAPATSPPVPRPSPRPGSGKEPKTPPNAPLGQKVRRTYFHLEFAKANAPAQSKPLIDVAKDTFDKADQLCTIGDLENGNQALDTVDDLTKAALSPDLQPSPPDSPASPSADPETQQRSNAQNTGLGLCRAANSLNDAGFPNLANSLRVTAGDLLNFALGLARSNKLIDLPFNIIEAFTGKTIEFDDSGEVVIRDATTTERVFAVFDVALAIGALASGGLGLPALLGAGALSKLDKDTIKKIEELAEGIKDKARRGESFEIHEFPGYPGGISKPSGSYKILKGNSKEYKDARKAANRANRKLGVKGKDVHEVKPIKFGGDPTDPANKEILSKPDHIKVSMWWRALQRIIEGK